MKKLTLLFTMLLLSWGMTTQAVDLYLIGETNLTTTWDASNKAGKMTYNSTTKLYTITATLNGYFAFTTTLDGNWDNVNANRYGPNPSGGVPVIGTTTKFGSARGDYSYNATNLKGEYKITVSLENETYLLEAQGEVTHIYTVVGTPEACNDLHWGDAFDVTTNDMTLVSGTTYQLEVKNCTLEKGTTYEYKIAQDKSWDVSYPSSNKTFTVSETAVYTVTYTFNSSTSAVSEKTTKTGEAGAITHTYNVAGAIKLPTDADDEATGKFVDGTTQWEASANQMTTTDDVNYTLSFTNVTIESGSTIRYKVCQDGKWGVSYGWGDEEGSVGGNDAWLYIGYSGTYTITFTFNATTKVLGATATRTGSANPVQVKFLNEGKWADVYLYAWNGKNKMAWPGEKLTTKDGDWFTYSINSGDSIIFNNGQVEEGQTLIQSSDIPKVTEASCYVWYENDARLDDNCDGEITIEYVTINFQKPETWGDVYVHVWGGVTAENTNWPGKAATFGLNGRYTVTLSKGAKFLLHSNNWEEVSTDNWQLKYQTVDLTATKDVCYNIGSVNSEGKYEVVENTACTALISETVNVKFQLPATWAKAYLYRWNDYGKNAWPGEEMTVDGDWVVTTIAKGDNIIINNGLEGENLIQSSDIEKVTSDACFLWDKDNKDAVLDSDCDGILELTYTVVGDLAVVNGEEAWNVNEPLNDMTLDTESGLYKLVVTGKTLDEDKTYGVKVIKNHAYANGEWPAENKTISVSERAVYTITYSFDASTKAIEVKTEKTGEAAPHTYTVAGVADIINGDKEWDATVTDNDMTKDEEDGLYKLEVKDLTLKAGSYTFKVVVDHDWKIAAYPVADENGDNNWVLNITEDGKYDILYTFNETTKDITATATRTDVVYVVAGSADALNGISWGVDAEENQMTLVDGLYTLVVKDATLDKGITYEYKITKNGAYVSDGDNLTFSVEERAIYEITYTYNATTGETKVTTKKTGEAGEITYTYTVAGGIKLPTDETEDTGKFLDGETRWDATANKMTSEDGTLYTLTFTDVAIEGGSTILFKICQNGGWSPAYGWGAEEGSVGGNNAWLYIGDTGTYTITFTFNQETHVVGVKAQRTDKADVYVVAGTSALLNDEEWNATSTVNQMTLVDGVYTLVIDEVHLEDGANYEYKIVKNGTQYIPEGYGNNLILTVDKTAVYEVTFTYQVVDGEDVIKATAKYLRDAEAITHTYTVAGSAAIVNGGTDWDPTNTANDMVLDTETGLYTLTVSGRLISVPGEGEDSYGFKVVVDHKWSPAYPAQDYIIDITEEGTYDIVYTFNADSKEVKATVTKTGGATALDALTLDINQPMYNILGVQVGKDYKGIVIQNGQKYLR